MTIVQSTIGGQTYLRSYGICKSTDRLCYIEKTRKASKQILKNVYLYLYIAVHNYLKCMSFLYQCYNYLL